MRTLTPAHPFTQRDLELLLDTISVVTIIKFSTYRDEALRRTRIEAINRKTGNRECAYIADGERESTMHRLVQELVLRADMSRDYFGYTYIKPYIEAEAAQYSKPQAEKKIMQVEAMDI